MRRTSRLARWAGGLAVLLCSGWAGAHEGKAKLPPGPIHDRHELMEGIGDHAKKIGEALKAGKTQGIAEEAAAINESAKRALPLFPAGSTHEHSRAKPEIWENWAEFERLMLALETDSAALAETARAGGDVGAASKKMFGTCKSCHDKFRKPED